MTRTRSEDLVVPAVKLQNGEAAPRFATVIGVPARTWLVPNSVGTRSNLGPEICADGVPESKSPCTHSRSDPPETHSGRRSSPHRFRPPADPSDFMSLVTSALDPDGIAAPRISRPDVPCK